VQRYFFGDARRARAALRALCELDGIPERHVIANTTGSDFRGEDLIAGERPVSVYLAVARADLDRMRPLLRIVLNQITRRLTREVCPGRRPVLLMLDEFMALGRLDFMHRGISFFRGYGVRVFVPVDHTRTQGALEQQLLRQGLDWIEGRPGPGAPSSPKLLA